MCRVVLAFGTFLGLFSFDRLWFSVGNRIEMSESKKRHVMHKCEMIS